MCGEPDREAVEAANCNHKDSIADDADQVEAAEDVIGTAAAKREEDVAVATDMSGEGGYPVRAAAEGR